MANERIFKEYARFYDHYYADKSYAAEVEFVLSLVSRYRTAPRSVLDMGCGTARHLECFAALGLNCHGFDLSQDMLDAAQARIDNHKIRLSRGDIRSFRTKQTFDLVVSLFAVMGYLNANEDLVSGFKTAAAHLTTSGVFAFDGWFGPAVLTQRPEKRHHRYKTGEALITRTAIPQLDPVRQTVTIDYNIQVNNDRTVQTCFQESHTMRFFFVQETAALLEMAGLELIAAVPFLQPDHALDFDTWNVTFLASKHKKTPR